MKDITHSMLEFKDAIRHAWNTYFALSEAPMSPEIQEAFSQVERGFFSAIVLAPMDATLLVREYREKSLPWLVVRPFEYLQECPVQFGKRDNLGNTIWEMPSNIAIDDHVAFEFFDFFDWNPFGFVDLSYVRARVAAFPRQSNIQGSLVLIEQRFCQFLFAEKPN